MNMYSYNIQIYPPEYKLVAISLPVWHWMSRWERWRLPGNLNAVVVVPGTNGTFPSATLSTDKQLNKEILAVVAVPLTDILYLQINCNNIQWNLLKQSNKYCNRSKFSFLKQYWNVSYFLNKSKWFVKETFNILNANKELYKINQNLKI